MPISSYEDFLDKESRFPKPPERLPTRAPLSSVASALVDAGKGTVTSALSGVASGIQTLKGEEPSALDDRQQESILRRIQRYNEDVQKNIYEKIEKNPYKDYSLAGISIKDLATFGHSLGASMPGMVGAIAGGIGSVKLGAPLGPKGMAVAGAAGSVAGSALLTQATMENQILYSGLQNAKALIEERGGKYTPEIEKSLIDEFRQHAKKAAFFEAMPEAIGQTAQLAILGLFKGRGGALSKAVGVKLAAEKGGEALAKKALKLAGKGAGLVGTELATEYPSELLGHEPHAKMMLTPEGDKHKMLTELGVSGLSALPSDTEAVPIRERSLLSYEDTKEALENVWAHTLLMMGTMGAGAKGISYLNRKVQDKRIDKVITQFQSELETIDKSNQTEVFIDALLKPNTKTNLETFLTDALSTYYDTPQVKALVAEKLGKDVEDVNISVLKEALTPHLTKIWNLAHSPMFDRLEAIELVLDNKGDLTKFQGEEGKKLLKEHLKIPVSFNEVIDELQSGLEKLTPTGRQTLKEVLQSSIMPSETSEKTIKDSLTQKRKAGILGKSEANIILAAHKLLPIAIKKALLTEGTLDKITDPLLKTDTVRQTYENIFKSQSEQRSSERLQHYIESLTPVSLPPSLAAIAAHPEFASAGAIPVFYENFSELDRAINSVEGEEKLFNPSIVTNEQKQEAVGVINNLLLTPSHEWTTEDITKLNSIVTPEGVEAIRANASALSYAMYTAYAKPIETYNAWLEGAKQNPDLQSLLKVVTTKPEALEAIATTPELAELSALAVTPHHLWDNDDKYTYDASQFKDKDVVLGMAVMRSLAQRNNVDYFMPSRLVLPNGKVLNLSGAKIPKADFATPYDKQILTDYINLLDPYIKDKKRVPIWLLPKFEKAQEFITKLKQRSDRLSQELNDFVTLYDTEVSRLVTELKQRPPEEFITDFETFIREGIYIDKLDVEDVTALNTYIDQNPEAVSKKIQAEADNLLQVATTLDSVMPDDALRILGVSQDASLAQQITSYLKHSRRFIQNLKAIARANPNLSIPDINALASQITQRVGEKISNRISYFSILNSYDLLVVETIDNTGLTKTQVDYIFGMLLDLRSFATQMAGVKKLTPAMFENILNINLKTVADTIPSIPDFTTPASVEQSIKFLGIIRAKIQDLAQKGVSPFDSRIQNRAELQKFIQAYWDSYTSVVAILNKKVNPEKYFLEIRNMLLEIGQQMQFSLKLDNYEAAVQRHQRYVNQRRTRRTRRIPLSKKLVRRQSIPAITTIAPTPPVLPVTPIDFRDPEIVDTLTKFNQEVLAPIKAELDGEPDVSKKAKLLAKYTNLSTVMYDLAIILTVSGLVEAKVAPADVLKSILDNLEAIKTHHLDYSKYADKIAVEVDGWKELAKTNPLSKDEFVDFLKNTKIETKKRILKTKTKTDSTTGDIVSSFEGILNQFKTDVLEGQIAAINKIVDKNLRAKYIEDQQFGFGILIGTTLDMIYSSGLYNSTEGKAIIDAAMQLYKIISEIEPGKEETVNTQLNKQIEDWKKRSKTSPLSREQVLRKISVWMPISYTYPVTPASLIDIDINKGLQDFNLGKILPIKSTLDAMNEGQRNTYLKKYTHLPAVVKEIWRVIYSSGLNETDIGKEILANTEAILKYYPDFQQHKDVLNKEVKGWKAEKGLSKEEVIQFFKTTKIESKTPLDDAPLLSELLTEFNTQVLLPVKEALVNIDDNFDRAEYLEGHPFIAELMEKAIEIMASARLHKESSGIGKEVLDNIRHITSFYSRHTIPADLSSTLSILEDIDAYKPSSTPSVQAIRNFFEDSLKTVRKATNRSKQPIKSKPKITVMFKPEPELESVANAEVRQSLESLSGTLLAFGEALATLSDTDASAFSKMHKKKVIDLWIEGLRIIYSSDLYKTREGADAIQRILDKVAPYLSGTNKATKFDNDITGWKSRETTPLLSHDQVVNSLNKIVEKFKKQTKLSPISTIDINFSEGLRKLHEEVLLPFKNKLDNMQDAAQKLHYLRSYDTYNVVISILEYIYRGRLKNYPESKNIVSTAMGILQHYPDYETYKEAKVFGKIGSWETPNMSFSLSREKMLKFFEGVKLDTEIAKTSKVEAIDIEIQDALAKFNTEVLETQISAMKQITVHSEFQTYIKQHKAIFRDIIGTTLEKLYVSGLEETAEGKKILSNLMILFDELGLSEQAKEAIEERIKEWKKAKSLTKEEILQYFNRRDFGVKTQTKPKSTQKPPVTPYRAEEFENALAWFNTNVLALYISTMEQIEDVAERQKYAKGIAVFIQSIFRIMYSSGLDEHPSGQAVIASAMDLANLMKLNLSKQKLDEQIAKWKILKTTAPPSKKEIMDFLNEKNPKYKKQQGAIDLAAPIDFSALTEEAHRVYRQTKNSVQRFLRALENKYKVIWAKIKAYALYLWKVFSNPKSSYYLRTDFTANLNTVNELNSANYKVVPVIDLALNKHENFLGSQVVTTSHEAASVFQKLFSEYSNEVSMVLITDATTGQILEAHRYSLDSQTQTIFPLDIIIGRAINYANQTNDQVFIWLGHNHPSGQPELTELDRVLDNKTAELVAGIKDVKIADSLVITPDKWSSFKISTPQNYKSTDIVQIEDAPLFMLSEYELTDTQPTYFGGRAATSSLQYVINEEYAEQLQQQYEQAISRTSAYRGNLKRHLLNKNGVIWKPYASDSVLAGQIVDDIFVVSHFAPTSLREGMRLLVDAYYTELPMAMAVPEYLGKQLEKLGFIKVLTVPQEFNGEMIDKSVYINRATTKRDLQTLLRYYKAGDTPLFLLNKEDVEVVGLPTMPISMTKSHIQEVVRDLTQTWAAQDEFIVVVDDINSPEVPDVVRNAIDAESPDYAGVHVGDKVYLFANKIISVDQIKTLLFHEWYGHEGVRLMGINLQQLYADIGGVRILKLAKKYNIPIADIKAELKRLGKTPEQIREVIANELLAYMQSETKDKHIMRALKSFWGRVRNYLRQAGLLPSENLTESDLFYILRQAQIMAMKRGIDQTTGDISVLASDTPHYMIVGPLASSEARANAQFSYTPSINPKTRYFLSDAKAKLILTDDVQQTLKQGGSVTLSQILDHPDLYEAYPWLKETPVKYDSQLLDSKTIAQYHLDGGFISLGILDKEIEVVKALLHEAQHAIQVFEGFPLGASFYNFYLQLQVDLVGSSKYLHSLDISKQIRSELLEAYHEAPFRVYNFATRYRILSSVLRSVLDNPVEITDQEIKTVSERVMKTYDKYKDILPAGITNENLHELTEDQLQQMSMKLYKRSLGEREAFFTEQTFIKEQEGKTDVTDFITGYLSIFSSDAIVEFESTVEVVDAISPDILKQRKAIIENDLAGVVGQDDYVTKAWLMRLPTAFNIRKLRHPGELSKFIHAEFDQWTKDWEERDSLRDKIHKATKIPEGRLSDNNLYRTRFNIDAFLENTIAHFKNGAVLPESLLMNILSYIEGKHTNQPVDDIRLIVWKSILGGVNNRIYSVLNDWRHYFSLGQTPPDSLQTLFLLFMSQIAYKNIYIDAKTQQIRISTNQADNISKLPLPALGKKIEEVISKLPITWDSSKSIGELYLQEIIKSRQEFLDKGIYTVYPDSVKNGKWYKTPKQETLEQIAEGRGLNGKQASELAIVGIFTNSLGAPWCIGTTLDYAEMYYKNSDTYIYKDEHDSPHVVIIVTQNRISEIRGVLANQDIEPEYQPVLAKFLDRLQAEGQVSNVEDYLVESRVTSQMLQLVEEYKGDKIPAKVVQTMLDEQNMPYEVVTVAEEAVEVENSQVVSAPSVQAILKTYGNVNLLSPELFGRFVEWPESQTSMLSFSKEDDNRLAITSPTVSIKNSRDLTIVPVESNSIHIQDSDNVVIDVTQTVGSGRDDAVRINIENCRNCQVIVASSQTDSGDMFAFGIDSSTVSILGAAHSLDVLRLTDSVLELNPFAEFTRSGFVSVSQAVDSTLTVRNTLNELAIGTGVDDLKVNLDSDVDVINVYSSGGGDIYLNATRAISIKQFSVENSLLILSGHFKEIGSLTVSQSTPHLDIDSSVDKVKNMRFFTNFDYNVIQDFDPDYVWFLGARHNPPVFLSDRINNLVLLIDNMRDITTYVFSDSQPKTITIVAPQSRKEQLITQDVVPTFYNQTNAPINVFIRQVLVHDYYYQDLNAINLERGTSWRIKIPVGETDVNLREIFEQLNPPPPPAQASFETAQPEPEAVQTHVDSDELTNVVLHMLPNFTTVELGKSADELLEIGKNQEGWELGSPTNVKIAGLHTAKITNGHIASTIYVASQSGNVPLHTFHEAFHSVQLMMSEIAQLSKDSKTIKDIEYLNKHVGDLDFTTMTEAQRNKLFKKMPILESLYHANKGNLKLSASEHQAILFSYYAAKRFSKQNTALIPKSVRQILDKILLFFQNLKSYLFGRGYRSSEQIFADAYGGQIKETYENIFKNINKDSKFVGFTTPFVHEITMTPQAIFVAPQFEDVAYYNLEGKKVSEILANPDIIQMNFFVPKGSGQEAGGRGTPLTLKELIDFPELFNRYPTLKEIKVRARINPALPAGYSTGHVLGDSMFIMATDYRELHRVLAHELNHLVANINGYMRGGSPRNKFIQSLAKRSLNYYNQHLRFQGGQFTDEDIQARMSLQMEFQRIKDKAQEIFGNTTDNSILKVLAFRWYERLGGEVMAREAEIRTYMSPERAAQTPPLSQPDVAKWVNVKAKDWILENAGWIEELIPVETAPTNETFEESAKKQVVADITKNLDANNPAKKTAWARFIEWKNVRLSEIAKHFTRLVPSLDPEKYPMVNDTFRLALEAGNLCAAETTELIQRVLGDLSEDKHRIFGYYLVAKQLQTRYAQEGVGALSTPFDNSEFEMAFGIHDIVKAHNANPNNKPITTKDAVDMLVEDYERQVNADPAIKAALLRRKYILETFRVKMLDYGLIDKKYVEYDRSDPIAVAKVESYFHRIVTEHADKVYLYGVAKTMRTGKKLSSSYPVIAGSSFITNYAVAEYHFIYENLLRMRQLDFINTFKNEADITQKVETEFIQTIDRATRQQISDEYRAIITQELVEAGLTGEALDTALEAALNKKVVEHVKQFSKDKFENYVKIKYPDFEIVDLEKYNQLYRGYAISPPAYEKAIAELAKNNGLKFKVESVKSAIFLGGGKNEVLIHKSIAEAIRFFEGEVNKTQSEISKAVFKLNLFTKKWMLHIPTRVVKWTINNTSGDADAAFLIEPKLAKDLNKLKKTFMDLWKYQFIKSKVDLPVEVLAEFEEAMQLRAINSGLYIREIEDITHHVLDKAIQSMELTQNFKSDMKKLMSLIKVDPLAAPGQVVQTYLNLIVPILQARENTLRFMAYQFYKKELASFINGLKTKYPETPLMDMPDSYFKKMPKGASNQIEIRKMIQAGYDIKNIAAKLAAELLGDYGYISPIGRWASQYAIPFHRWTEVNFRRYANVYKNLWTDPTHASEFLSQKLFGMAVKIPLMTLKLSGFLFFITAVNMLLFPREWDELYSSAVEKGRMFIILGRNEDGSIRTARIEGAFTDFLRWGDLEAYPFKIYKVLQGEANLKEEIVNTAKAPINKLTQGILPAIKTPMEAFLFERTYFPDIFDPRPIRDKGEHIARLMAAETIWDYAIGKPRKAQTNVWSYLGTVVGHTLDAKEAAYFESKRLATKYTDKLASTTWKPETLPSGRGNNLYYFKRALKLGDRDAAIKYLTKYVEDGGKLESISISIDKEHPLASIPLQFRASFLKSLTSREKDIIDMAIDWHTSVYKTDKKFTSQEISEIKQLAREQGLPTWRAKVAELTQK